MFLIAFGTRPEYLKIKPILELLPDSVPCEVLFTGQHMDLVDELTVAHRQITISDNPTENRLDNIVSVSYTHLTQPTILLV